MSAFPQIARGNSVPVPSMTLTTNASSYGRNQCTLQAYRDRLEFLEYHHKATTEGRKIRDILEKLCPPKGYRMRATSFDTFEGLSYKTDIPGVTIEVVFFTHAWELGAPLGTPVGTIGFSPNPYYGAKFPALPLGIRGGNFQITADDIMDVHNTIKVELKNCYEMVPLIKTYPLCTCCGIPLFESVIMSQEQYAKTMNNLGNMMKNHLRGIGDKPKKSQSLIEYEDHPEALSNGDLYVWKCKNCSRSFYPWERTDVPPEYNTQHPHYKCYCDGALRYTLNSGGELVMRCINCKKYIVEEEAIAIALSKA